MVYSTGFLQYFAKNMALVVQKKFGLFCQNFGSFKIKKEKIKVPMTTKLEGGGGGPKALEAGLLKKELFTASLTDLQS